MEGKIVPVGAKEQQIMSYKLARQVYDSGFKPDWLIALWRGGTIVGCHIHEAFRWWGHEADHIAVRTSKYEKGSEEKKKVDVYSMGYFVREGNADQSVLVVDDVFDTGESYQGFLNMAKKRMRLNLPKDIRIATLHWKPEKNKTDLLPDYFLEKGDANIWYYYSHELENLNINQVEKYKGKDIADILRLD